MIKGGNDILHSNFFREHVAVVLDSIFEISTVVTKAVYTDNPAADKKTIEHAFSSHFYGRILTLQVW